MDDGYRLPLRRWGNPETAGGVVLALHGFNDYGQAFAGLGDFLGAEGRIVYAVDQRGFGAAAQRGRWAGEPRLTEDLVALVDLLHARHPALPLTLVGESMGGAVLLAAAPRLHGVQGLVLIAPAVWDRKSMPMYQRLLLTASAYTVPGLELTGRGLGIRPTDNDPFWRAYSADPLVIKATRVDALWGMANLMDQATWPIPETMPPILLLYGEHDQVIPKRAFCNWLVGLSPRDTEALRLVVYRRGWHMLTRDRQGAWVMADIAAWIQDHDAPLPSGEEVAPDGPRVQALCPGETQSPTLDGRHREPRAPSATMPSKSLGHGGG
jgi:alpha-beta hydrolase superfamily lysophospholipase